MSVERPWPPHHTFRRDQAGLARARCQGPGRHEPVCCDPDDRDGHGEGGHHPARAPRRPTIAGRSHAARQRRLHTTRGLLCTDRVRSAAHVFSSDDLDGVHLLPGRKKWMPTKSSGRETPSASPASRALPCCATSRLTCLKTTLMPTLAVTWTMLASIMPAPRTPTLRIGRCPHSPRSCVAVMLRVGASSVISVGPSAVGRDAGPTHPVHQMKSRGIVVSQVFETIRVSPSYASSSA